MEPKIDDAFEQVLLNDVVPALGCTEPTAIALAAAKARAVLGETPEQVVVTCSGNIIKNAMSVVVPNSQGRSGVATAAALGTVAGDPEVGLECLNSVTDADIPRADALVAEGRVRVDLAEGIPGLYIRVNATAGDASAEVVLQESHSHFASVKRNGVALWHDDSPRAAASANDAAPDPLFTVNRILDFAEHVDFDEHPELATLLDRQVEINGAIAAEGLRTGYGAQVGPTLLATADDDHPDLRTRARAAAAAGSDARMSGSSMPVMINSGSGNQGMTVSVPLLVYAEELGTPRDQLRRALIVSNLVAIYEKRYIGKLSAFCGAVSAAVGAGAGIAYLQGLSREQIAATIVNALASSGGVVCDGAKASCAAKISMGVNNAIDAVNLAKRGHVFGAGEGVVGDDVDATIRNVGRIAKDGMRSTDVEILQVMLEQHAR